MFEFRRISGALSAVFIAAAFLSACGGSHSTSAVPGVPAGLGANGLLHASAATAGGNIIAINAGGTATGIFSADADYTSAGTWTYKDTAAINTSLVTNAAPQSVYQTDREGSAITYTLPGLTPGTAYSVNLSFVEPWWTSAGQRTFNVTINNTTVLSNFDVFAASGARFKAIAKAFTATASATGTIVVKLTAVINYAEINAIEVAAVSTATPTPAPGGISINGGGAATGSFIADADFTAAGTWTYATSATIDTTGVTNPAPQAVYQSQRDGSSIAYKIPGLTAGAAYTVRLDFAELYWSAAGQRVFTIAINGQNVLANFDIVATAGAAKKAVAKSFTATADSTGAIAIALTAVTNYPAISGLEISAAGGAAPTPTPTALPTAAGFNDYTTFGYDNQRDVYNPNTTAITPASVPAIHLAWQAALGGGDYNTLTQPVLATGIGSHAGMLFVGGGSGNMYGYDATSGKQIWSRSTGQEQFVCEAGNTFYFGIGGSAAYDPASKSIYIVGNSNSSPNTVGKNTLLHLDAATGSVLGQVDFAPAVAGWPSLDFSHTSVTLNNGTAYVGTGATCDISSWRGRVAAVSVPAMTLQNTFYTAWNGTTQPWGGGGVWGWGGVSLDYSGNVLTGVGNVDNGTTNHGSIVAPFKAAPQEYSAQGDALVKLSPDLSTLLDSNHPIPTSAYSGDSVDLDLAGTPAVFQPSGTGCDALAALQGKSGAIYLYDTARVGSGPVAQYQLAPSTYSDGFLGGPAYSYATGLLYVAVTSSSNSLYSPGMMAVNPGCGHPSVVWHSAFGPDSYPSGVPRSVPAVSAGGVVFVGTICTADGNGGCSGTATSSVGRHIMGGVRKPLICCSPPGSSGGAVWAIDASSGSVLNGGLPVITTSAPLRVPPTLDGNWLFVLDNGGNFYGLTIDSHVAATSAIHRSVDSRMLKRWEPAPRS